MAFNLKQINPKKTPEKFYLPDKSKPTIIYDENGEVIETKYPYTLTYRDISDDFTAGKVLRKPCIDGEQDLHVYDDVTKLFHNGILVCAYKVYLEELIDGVWIKYDFGETLPIIIDIGKLGAVKDVPPATFDCALGWKGGDPKTERSSKIVFSLGHTGFTIRVKWYLKCYDTKYITGEPRLQLSYDDYDGNTSDTEWKDSGLGYFERTIIFEPDGVQDSLVVDPYLSITETSTTVNISTSDFEIEFDEAKGGVIDIWYTDGGSTNYADATNGLLDHFINDGAEKAQHSITTGGVLEVIEQLSTRCTIRFAGDLTTNVPFVQTITVYDSGYVSFETKVTNNTGASITGSTGGVRIKTDATNYASDTEIADNSNDATPTYNTEYWFGQYATGLNSVFCFILSADSDAQQDIYASSANSNEYRKDTVTFADGTSYLHKCFLYIEGTSTTEADIENDGKFLVPSVRVDATINTGSAITDMNIPDNIDTDGLNSNIARAISVNGTNYNAKITFNQAEKRPVVELYDFPVMSGSTPDEHILERFFLEDNTASSTISAETGNDANWENVSDGSDRNTDTSGDSVTAKRGNGLDTQDGAGYIDLTLGNYLNTFFKKGTIEMNLKPQFGFDDASNQTIFHCYIDASNEILLYYDATNDKFQLDVVWGSTSLTLAGSVYTSNNNLQQWRYIKAYWDSDKDFVGLHIDDEVVDSGTNTGSPSASNPTKVTIGAKQDRTLPGDFIFDTIISYDDVILSYGAYFTGNGSVDTSIAHTEITLFWSGNNSDDVEIGGIAGSKSGGIYDNASPLISGEYYYDNNGAGTNYMKLSKTFPMTGGKISFWINAQALVSNDYFFGTLVNSSNYFGIRTDATNGFILRLSSAGASTDINYGSTDINQVWAYVTIRWGDITSATLADRWFELWINGILIGSSNVGNQWAVGNPTYFCMGNLDDGTVYSGFGCDCFIANVYLLSSINIPQHPTVFGKPLWSPLLQVG